MRWWIFHADTNGLAKAIVRISGRVYLDRDVFNQWLEDQRDEPIPPMDVKPEDFSFE